MISNCEHKMSFVKVEDKSLHLVGGCYGTWSGKRGFSRLTNFRMEPLGFLSSKRFLLKGMGLSYSL